jgi:glutamate synthase domain-containing protein 3
MADLYWYARGGSYTDGGAFIFTVEESKNLLCTDKFGKIISTNKNFDIAMKLNTKSLMEVYEKLRKKQKPIQLFENIASKFGDFDLDEVYLLAESMKRHARKGDEERANVIETLTLLIDRRYDTGWKRRSAVIPIFERALFDIFDSIGSSKSGPSSNYLLVDCGRRKLTGPSTPNRTLVIDACDFHPEGEICEFLEEACRIGWRKIIAYNFRGQRNFGAGLVTGSEVRIDLYGRVGDCLASFADGPEFYVHGSVQDSVAYCFRSGKIVVFGDAGKAFEYGAKGGVAYVLGDLIDRPLINAVGSSKAVINGSCKDYMGESFMAASGFIILNGIRFDESGKVVEQETPYQGGNIFPLAAAGSIYIRDPWKTVGEDQLNGGKICEISREDWEKILPFLEENEQLFGIKVEDLLKVGGVVRRPEEVYRKVVPAEVAALARYEGGD